MAAKKTAELIPLCHPISLTDVGIDFAVDRALPGLRASAWASSRGPTGVEMEALSFKGTVDAVRTYTAEIRAARSVTKRNQLWQELIRAIVSDVVGRDRKLSWKVGLCASRLARDLRALSNVRGISLKKMREIREDLVFPFPVLAPDEKESLAAILDSFRGWAAD